MKPVFTKEQILSAFEKRTASIIFSYGAFDIFGIACLIGDYAFRFDPYANPLQPLREYYDTHTQEEMAEKVCAWLNGEKTPEWKREYFAKELEKEAWEVEERWE